MIIRLSVQIAKMFLETDLSQKRMAYETDLSLFLMFQKGSFMGQILPSFMCLEKGRLWNKDFI